MKKILLSFILAGIGFSTALAQQQTVPGIKATFDGKTVYYKTGEAPVLSYKVDEQAKTKNALIHLNGITKPVLDVTLTQQKNLEIEHAGYVEPKVKVEGVSDIVDYKEPIFPDLKFTFGEGAILTTNDYYVLFKAIAEDDVEKDVDGTPTEAGKYNMYVTFKYPYYGTVKQTFAIVDHQQVLKDLIEGAAAECLEKTKGQVPDDVHNALDAALEKEIETAKEVAGTDSLKDAYYKEEVQKLQQAMENSYQQYWFDQLAQLIVKVDVYQMGMSEGDAKNKLVEALKEANKVCQGKIDKNKSSEVYKEAYDDLWKAYQEAIKAEVKTQLAGLGTAIMSAYVVKNDIAYEEYQDELQTNGIAVADSIYKVYPKTEYALSDITVLKKAITTLKNKVATVQTADYSKAKDALTDSIGYATTSKGTIEQVSKVIADALGSAIATAQGVLDATEPAATAKELKSAAETLGAARFKAEKDFETFKTVKSDLKDAIDASNTTLAGIDSKHEAIKAALNDAVETADSIYDDAINKTIDELQEALTNINTANDAAKASEAVADQIDDAVTAATTALTGIVDTEIKSQLDAAIATANEAVKNYAAKEDLSTALTAISNATSGYVSSDIAKARQTLNAKMTKAQEQIDSVLAYDEYKSQLSGAKEAAKTVSDNTASTAQELTAAADTLTTAITTIVGNDGKTALDDLNDVIAEAQNKYTEVNAINTTIADTLKAEIDKATGLAKEGSARERKAETTDLGNAINAANTAVGTYNGNVEAIGKAIENAETLSDQIDEDYTGIKAALADAIEAANGVLENSKNKTNTEIEQAITTLNNANTEATNANTNAQNLERQIALAEDALVTIVDSTKYAELKTAIDSAKTLFADKTKTSADYNTACTALSTKIDQIVSDDILLAKNALTGAIGDANTAKSGVVLNESKNGIDGVVATATATLNKTGVTAMELDDAKDALNDAVAQIVADDLVKAKQKLSDAIAAAETAKKPYADIADSIKNADAKANYTKLVTDPFTNAIGKATTVKDSETSTSKNMMDNVEALGIAEKAMEAAYKARMAIETQELANVYSSEKYLAAEVDSVNNVIAGAFKTATAKAAEVYGSILSDPETTYTLADIINARIGMDDEYKTLQNEFNAWNENIVSLNKLITEAGNVKKGLQDVHQETVGAALQTAIDAAQAIYDARAKKFSKDINDAISALQEAIDTAKYDDTNWDFTDADLASDDSKFKAGKYAAEHAKYTRTGSAIAVGNYATFCMPMEIKVAYGDTAKFSSVYLPTDFAILNTDTKILKLFLTKVEEGGVIPAGTPFFAQLACADSLVLKNNSELTVVADPASVAKNPTTIKIYDQTANSSFVTLDKDITFVWNGTYQKTTETTDKFVFNTSGSFGKAGASINAFRAYLEQNSKTQNVKNIMDIEVEFGDGGEVTGIEGIMAGASDDTQIYSIDGKKMGNDMKSLNKGVYIINGKKVLK